MSDSNDHTIVISDLLSFMACKIHILSKNDLLSCLRDFYSRKEADEALRTFLSSLPPKKLKNYQHKCYKGSDSLTILYNFLKRSPNQDFPVFVCRDLNNIPKPDSYDKSSYDQDDHKDLVNEQKFIKSQISEITSVVYQLRDQIQVLIQNKNSVPVVNNKTKERGLAYLQKLIDEEEKEKVHRTIVVKEELEEIYLPEILDGDCNESIEEEQTLHLKANRVQRALVKNAESINLEKEMVTLSKHTSPISSDAEMEEEEKLVLKQKVIHIEDEEFESNDNLTELSSEFSESEVEKSPTKIYLDKEGSSYLEEIPSIPLESGSEEEKFPFIVVEQVFDENVGHFSIYKCSLCNFSTNDASAVQQHDCPQIYSEEPIDGKDDKSSKSFRYFCLHCRFKCNSKLLFKKHTQTHPQSYPCPFCSEKFLESEAWTEHVMVCVNSGERNSANHVCQVCGIVYANSGALLVHKGFHDPAKPFECLKCRYRFYTQETLDRHFKSHVINGFKCPFCHFVNKNKTTLSTHIRCHTGEMPFACQYCDYRSSSQSALTSHSFCHTDKKPIKCSECPALFKTLHKLNSHKITHRKNRIHKCPVCGKGFKTGWLMTIHHQRIHLNLRPHACDHCNYKARSLSALKSHLSTHSNEKLFKCFECDFRANHKGYLKRHINTWHPEKK